MRRRVPYGLDPDFFDRLSGLQQTVPNLQVVSGFRSWAQQQQIRDDAARRGWNPDDYAAPPDGSVHTVGENRALGADLVGDLGAARMNASAFGLVFPLRNDPWHVEPYYVTHEGLPYSAPPARVTYDFVDTSPTVDDGLNANLQNQARARAAEKAGVPPSGVPPEMLDVSRQPPQGFESKPTEGKGLAEGTTQEGGKGPETLSAGKGETEEQKTLNQTKLVPQPDVWVPGSASGTGGAIVNAAMAKLGKPYSTSGRFGPNAYDCSGLVVAALRDVGIDPGGNTVSTSLQTWGQPIDLETAYNTPGAMLFVWGYGPAGHVEISRGDGTTIGSSRGGVQVRPARGRGWTGAALPPGVGGGSPGGFRPVSPIPQRISPEEAYQNPSFGAAAAMDLLRRGSPRAGMLGKAPDNVLGQNGKKQEPTPQPTQQPAPQPAPETLPSGAPPPVPQPGNPNPVGAPSPVAPGEVLSEEQKQEKVLPYTASPEEVGGAAARGTLAHQKVTQEGAPQAAQAEQQQQQGQAGQGDWDARLLAAIGAPDTPENRRFLDAWQRAEGGSADNPYNTTQSMPGASNFNSVGVKRYASIDDGLTATVKTLTNGKYEEILAALRRGNSAKAAAQALANSPWGTGSLVMRILG